MMLVSYFESFVFYYHFTVFQGFLSVYSLCVFALEKVRLEELKEKLASPSLKCSAKQMYPIVFEKVGQACSETSAAHTAEAADRLAAECSQGAVLSLIGAFRIQNVLFPSNVGSSVTQNLCYSTTFMKQSLLVSCIH